MAVTRHQSGPSSAKTPKPLSTATSAPVKRKPKSADVKTTKSPPSDLQIHPFETTADFEAFLDANHLTSPGIHVKLARKASGIPSITHAELVEVVLCFGWIDGQGNGFDDNYYLTRCTPRRNKSLWSQKNVSTFQRLLEEGRVRPAGIAAVNAAKADGRWDMAYAGPKNITVHDDLQAALDVNEAAKIFFKSLKSAERYAVLWRVETANPTARAGRIKALVDGLAAGNVPGRRKEDLTTSKPRKGGVQKSSANKSSQRSTSKAKE